jgi:signal transduction histidine kinase
MVTQTWVSLAAAALVFGALGGVYFRHSKNAQAEEKVRTTLEAYGRAIKSDLELGDFWAVRKTLGTTVDTGALDFVKVVDGQSRAELLRLPFRPKGWETTEPSAARGRVEIRSEDGERAWFIEGGSGLGLEFGDYAAYLGLYAGLILFLLLVIGLLIWRAVSTLALDIRSLEGVISQLSGARELKPVTVELHTRETEHALHKIKQVSQMLIENVARERRLAVSAAVGNVATQVAHDIRSPLAALAVVEKDLGSLEESKRILLRAAIDRIRDIANDLLSRSREAAAPSGEQLSVAVEETSAQLISDAVDQLVSEKRLQYRSRPEIRIEGDWSEEAYGLFARVQPRELSRLISNLVNNAVEAIEGSGSGAGQVRLRVQADGSDVRIRVEDNGRGIAPEALPGLTARGATSGKTGGLGLGLHHARTQVEAWGGSLRIESRLGHGTAIELRIPRAPTPAWFVPVLTLPPGTRIAILDDDPSIHELWKNRFGELPLGEDDIEVHHFLDAGVLRDWIQGPDSAKAIYLVDYELLGSRLNGLQLIEALGIAERSILVTSLYHKEEVRKHGARLGVRLIPKGAAAFVPLLLPGSAISPLGPISPRDAVMGGQPESLSLDLAP